MFTKTQLVMMLQLQDDMNSKINNNWITEDNKWLRAAMIECAEGIDHHGYKWWKHQDRDLPQLQMELVDIWHFALSHIIKKYNKDFNLVCSDIFNEFNKNNFIVRFDEVDYDYRNMSLLNNLDLLCGLSAANRFDVLLFSLVIKQAGMTTDDLYKHYIGKNVLNFFRQDNGYKDGTYIKIWEGREDNEFLVEALMKSNINSISFKDDIYDYLKTNYPS
jgi:dimeric dUTPase (all-alpha-NTP-PPase superfamily)